MFHPSRGGVRGGADQFEWETVKADKHRENYLGHSLMAPVGRWQKNKDLQWFSREKKGSSNSKESEKEAIRRMEAEAMAAALGKAPVKRAPAQLTKQELDEVCRKGQTERDDRDIERIEGMGFGSTRASLMTSGDTKETMSAIGCQVTKVSVRQEDRTGQENTNSEEIKKQKKKEKKEKRKKRSKRSKTSKRSKRYDSDISDDEKIKRRHRRGHSDDKSRHITQNPKKKRHDSTSDSSSDFKNVQKQRHDSVSDDEPYSKKKQPNNNKGKLKRCSSEDEYRHSKYGQKETRRERHDSYSD